MSSSTTLQWCFLGTKLQGNVMERQITLLLMYTYSCSHHVCLEASSQMMKRKQMPLNLHFKPAQSCTKSANSKPQIGSEMFPEIMFFYTCSPVIYLGVFFNNVLKLWIQFKIHITMWTKLQCKMDLQYSLTLKSAGLKC